MNLLRRFFVGIFLWVTLSSFTAEVSPDRFKLDYYPPDPVWITILLACLSKTQNNDPDDFNRLLK